MTAAINVATPPKRRAALAQKAASLWRATWSPRRRVYDANDAATSARSKIQFIARTRLIGQDAILGKRHYNAPYIAQ